MPPIGDTAAATAQKAANIAQTVTTLVHSAALSCAINIALVTAHAQEAAAAMTRRHVVAPRRQNAQPAQASANASKAIAMLSMDCCYPVPGTAHVRPGIPREVSQLTT